MKVHPASLLPQRCPKCKGEAEAYFKNTNTREVQVRCVNCGEQAYSFQAFTNALGVDLTST